VEKDNRQFRRFVSEDFGDIRRRFPKHHLPTHSLPLEHEMKEGPWATILVVWRRPFPDGDFDRHRELFESCALLVVR
jgi:hypothetical protein